MENIRISCLFYTAKMRLYEKYDEICKKICKIYFEKSIRCVRIDINRLVRN